MSQIAATWRLIPAGVSSIVKITIEGEFTVPSSITTVQLEEYIAHLLGQISTEDESSIRQKLEAERWLGDVQRPDEPTTNAIPAPETEEPLPGVHGLEDSSLSAPGMRAKPFFIATVAGAVLWVFAILGFLSILQRLGGG